VARLAGLRVTGSIGILLRACQTGRRIDLQSVRRGMDAHGVWVSEAVWHEAMVIAQSEPSFSGMLTNGCRIFSEDWVSSDARLNDKLGAKRGGSHGSP
jgi:hypothetical protein